jgi:hypothetical protein
MLDDHSKAGGPVSDETDPHPDASVAAEPPTSAVDPSSTVTVVGEPAAEEEDGREAVAAALAVGDPELGWSAARVRGLQAEAAVHEAERAALEAADADDAETDAHENGGDDRAVDAEFASSPQRLGHEVLREDSVIDEYGYERTRAEMSGRKLNKGIDSIRRQREW